MFWFCYVFCISQGVIQTVDCNRPLSSLICIDPPALLRAILSIHIDNPNQTFQFEAKRFWPKDCANGKPSPGLLVRALEEIALRGYIRECVFPLIWQVCLVYLNVIYLSTVFHDHKTYNWVAILCDPQTFESNLNRECSGDMKSTKISSLVAIVYSNI